MNNINNEPSLRSMIAETSNSSFTSASNLREAKKNNSMYVIMEGDYGGQIYLVCPASFIICNEGILKKLLTILDDSQWADETGANLSYEALQNNQIVTGGMGGGVAIKNNLWIHERLKHIKPLLLDILVNQKKTFEYDKLLKKLRNALKSSK